MPLHTSTHPAPTFSRLAAIAAATVATAGAVIIVADDQASRQPRTVAESSQPSSTRYFDIEANKAASMRALGLHIARQRASSLSRYDDLEGNKARSARNR